MNLQQHYLLALATTCITVFILAVFVAFQKIDKRRKWSFFFYSLCISVWALGQGCAIFSKNQIVSLWAVRLCHAGVVFIPPLFIHFIMSLMDATEKYKSTLRKLYAISIFFFISNFGPYIVKQVDVYPPVFDYVYVPGILHPLMLVYWVVAVTYGLILALNGYVKSSGIRRVQLQYFFWATLCAYIGGAPNFLLGYRIQVPILMPFGTYILPIYVAVLAYAMLAHHLMDIEVIVKKTLVFAGLFVASYAVLASFAYSGSAIFGNIIRNPWIAMAPSVLILVLMLRPLEIFLRNITDKYLFQKEYDYRLLLRTFSDEVLTVLDLDMLVNLTVNKLTETMKLENATILLHDDENDEFRIVASAGLGDAEYELGDNEKLISYMRQNGEHILLESSKQKKALSKNIEKKIQDLQAVLVIPLSYQKDMVGILSLGKKKSDEEFTQEDIDMLLPLARTLSIAINNAQLFEKLSEAQAQAAQREKMAVIGTLSAGINHEICNPLGIARGQCEMFLLNMKDDIYKDKDPQELMEKAKEIMQKVINETDRATVITRKLSSFAKPARDKMEDTVEVKKELDEVVSLVEHDLELDNITIEKDIEKDLPYIAADRKQLQEIFFNIVRNAAQSIVGSGKIIIRAKSDNKKVYIDIEDTGIGISRANLERIFNPFFTTKEPGRGTGLGLFIAKQIVERNRGRITVQSESGKGTVFSLMFDAVASEKVQVK